jgi:nitrite reductase/ring-hydroxylating ferredoxin subunit
MIDVGSEESFADGAVKLVRVGAQEVGVVRWNGSFYAIRNICPHQFGPVCNGTLRPLLVASGTGPRDLACDSSRPVITCPWHGWEFYVDSGRAVWSPGYRVRTYDVQVSDGRVYVNQPAGRDTSDDE